MFFIRVTGGSQGISKVYAAWLVVAGGQCKQQPVAVDCISGMYAFFSHKLDPIFLVVAWDLRYLYLNGHVKNFMSFAFPVTQCSVP